MPCNGVAVISAKVGLDIAARFAASEALRDALVADLAAQGFTNVYATASELWVSGQRVTFIGAQVRVRGGDRAILAAVERYCSELVQAEVLNALTAAGVQVSNAGLDENGTLFFNFATEGF